MLVRPPPLPMLAVHSQPLQPGLVARSGERTHHRPRARLFSDSSCWSEVIGRLQAVHCKGDAGPRHPECCLTADNCTIARSPPFSPTFGTIAAGSPIRSHPNRSPKCASMLRFSRTRCPAELAAMRCTLHGEPPGRSTTRHRKVPPRG